MGGNNPGGAANPEAIFAQSMSAFQLGDFERAIRHGDRLLEVTGNAGDALLWAVRLRLEAGRWDEAIVMGLQSLDRSPGISGLVGHACELLGKIAEAQPFFERAVAEQPDNPAWHYHNASTLSRLYRDYESLESLRRAAALAPDKDGQLILAALELKFGDAEAGLREADKAAELAPKNESCQVVAAKSLMALGRLEEADERWSKAFSLSNESESLRLQRAIALTRHGKFDEGIAAFKSMIDSNPKFLPAYVQVVAAKRISRDDIAWLERMKEFQTDEAVGDSGRIALQFALGKAHDNLGDYETAMRHFNEANRLQYAPIGKTGGFDRQGYTANMALRERVYGRDTVAELAKTGNPTPIPIFVLGMIRSGTTLAEQILSSHPQVSGAGEQEFWINADIRLMDYQQASLNTETLRASAETYLRLLAGFARGAADRVVDKQPGNLILAGALHIAFPNARIIYMRRNPVDTAVSIWTTHLQTSARFVNVKSNIVHAFREHDKLMEHWRRVIPADRFLEVSYESLITDRINITRRILNFCDLPWDDACLSPEKNEKLVITPSLWQVRQPIYRTSMDRWRNYEPWLDEFAELFEP